MKQILPAIYIDGKIVDQKSAAISVFNEGFLYGMGIFTTIKVRQGCPLFFEHHLNRLETSSKQLGIQLPSYVKKAVYVTIKKNKLIDGGIRITLTPATIAIHAFTLKPLSPSASALDTLDTPDTLKIKLITTPDTRDIYKTHKLTYRLPHLLAQKKARSKGSQDALFTQNNKLIESTTANIISYVNNTLITPPIYNNCLNGITRQILMENLPIREAPITQNTTNPLILVNSLSLRIIESIDGKKIKQNAEFVNLIRQTIDEAEKTYIASSKLVRLGRKN